MVERARPARVTDGAEPRARLTVASFVATASIAVGALTLDEDAAHHARVRRLEVGDPVTVRDGAGVIGEGSISRLAKHALDVDLQSVVHVAPPPPLHLLAPVGDRDRMLWLAEKAVEIGAATWRAVRWQRSKSVSPRGEGDVFVAKLRARMRQALAQCEGAWLPTVYDADELRVVLGAMPPGIALVLDADGGAFDSGEDPRAADGVSLAVGPEGGLEPAELSACEAAGFRRARLPGNILRFETAGVVGLAFARTLVERARSRATHFPTASTVADRD